jgi:hypothetical protein
LTSSILHQLGYDFPLVLARTGLIHSSEQDDPLVRCLFFPLAPADRTPGGICRSIPLGQLADLRDGDVIHPDGRVTSYQGSRTYTTRVRVSGGGGGVERVQDRKALIQDGMLPLLAVDNVSVGATGASQSKWVVVRALSDDIDYLLIPAFLLFWTYFAPNSKLASAYYSGSIFETIDSLARAKTTRRPESGECELKLGRGHLASDSIPLGRIVFDESGTARRAAENVARWIQLANRHQREFALDCNFPFEGDTTLIYRAAAYQSKPDGPRVHRVLDILECQFPLPWRTLHVTLDQPKRVPGIDGDPAPLVTGTVVEDFEDDFGQLDPDEDPPEPSNPIVLRARKATDFSVPGSQAVLILRREIESGGKGGVRRRKRRALSARQPSIEPGTGNQQSHVAPPVDSSVETEPTQPAEVMSPVAALSSVLDSLRDLREVDGFHTEPLHMFPNLVAYAGQVLNEVPLPPPGQSKSWSNIKQGLQRRCFLIMTVERGDRFAYLLEILRNPGESYSTLLLMRPDGRPIDIFELDRFFSAVGRRGALPSDKELKDLTTAVIYRIKHPSPNSGPEAWSLLRRTIRSRF